MPLALQRRITTVDIQGPVTWELLNERLLEISHKAKDEDKKGWFPTPFYRKKKPKRGAIDPIKRRSRFYPKARWPNRRFGF